MADAFDMVVLGAGTGGYAAALHAAQLGMRVALIERDKVGGTCLHRGCIPTKALLHSAEVLDEIRSAKRFGITVDPSAVSVDWPGVQDHKKKVVNKLVSGLEGLIKQRKIEVVAGEGVLEKPGRVQAGDRTLEAPHTVVATGSAPKMIPGLEPGERIITSDEALEAGVPKSAIVLGGGSVGVEFASIWRSFGADVTVVEMLPTLVPLEDEALGSALAKAFSKRGIKVLTGAKLEEAAATGSGVTAKVSTNGKTETLKADVLLVAVGRGPVTDGLEKSGLAVDRGYVPVRGACETNLAGVFAVGDVVALEGRGHPQLAHVAFAEGILVAEKASGRNPVPINYDAIPRATYCVPEVAAVGLTESQAREQGHDVVTKVVNFQGIGKAAILGETTGFCKVVAAKDGPILGVHYVGPRVTELVAEAMLAVGWEALPEEVAALIHPHPTLTEAFGEATLAMAGKALHTA